MSVVLVTGGSGFIGSHTVLVLLEAGFDVVVLDNLSNSSRESLERVQQLTDRSVEFIEGDILDGGLLRDILERHQIQSVVHFAGLKAVGESVEQPLSYYGNNVLGTLNLVRCMKEAGIRKLVFSSSATVYGNNQSMPLSELDPVGIPSSPYGKSKLMVEQILQDLAASSSDWSIGLLRYFNPVGAHPSGLIGEDPSGVPNNLLPYITQVAIGKREYLAVYGNDYPTSDGTGVRDYIHVMDLARGHLAALNYLVDTRGVSIWNLGTGIGHSVLELVDAFEKSSGRQVPFRFVQRRSGDIAECWADPSKAKRELGWSAELGLAEMMADAWRWQHQNPDGYSK